LAWWIGSAPASLESNRARWLPLPISGAYAEFVCLPQGELIPVPPGLDAAEAVGLVLNYITAYDAASLR
jgi:NADPH:quinone reductase-like Zn-dependent oxidoreductase